MISLFMYTIFPEKILFLHLLFITNWTQLSPSCIKFSECLYLLKIISIFLLEETSAGLLLCSNLQWLLPRPTDGTTVTLRSLLQHHAGDSSLSQVGPRVPHPRTLSWFTSFWWHVPCSSFLRKGVQTANFWDWASECVFSPPSHQLIVWLTEDSWISSQYCENKNSSTNSATVKKTQCPFL